MIPLEVESNTQEQTVKKDEEQNNMNDDDEEEDFEEVMGLLSIRNPSKSPGRSRRTNRHTDDDDDDDYDKNKSWLCSSSTRAWKWWIVTMCLVTLMTHYLSRRENQWEEEHSDEGITSSNSDTPIHYGCPQPKTKKENGRNNLMTVVFADPEVTSMPNDPSDKDDWRVDRGKWTKEQIVPYLFRPIPSSNNGDDHGDGDEGDHNNGQDKDQ